jgi:hypothetical protein
VAADGTGLVQGRVDGAAGGSVRIYRETTSGRVALGAAQVAADGTFSFQDGAPASPTLYRAVYVDAATGIPYAALLRTPVG